MQSKTISKDINADSLFELLTSRISSYVFEISLDLGLFHYLHGAPKTMESVSRFCKLPRSSTRIILQYLCSSGLVTLKEGLFTNSKEADNCLMNNELEFDLRRYKIEGNMLEFRRSLEAPDSQPWYQMKDNQKKIADTTGITESFFTSEQIHAWRIRKGEELAESYDFTDHKQLLDVGGASGGWSIGILQSNKHLVCNLLDLPEVCRLSEGLLQDYVSLGKLRITPGDFFNDEFPAGADVILFANVLHDWSETDGTKILKKAYDYLPIGGSVLVYEFYLNEDWRGPLSSAYHGLTVLGPDNASGWQPSYLEMEEILDRGGFSQIKKRNNLLSAVK